jgi:hypothetical protein
MEPQTMHTGKPTGASMAALVGAALGLLTLAIVQVATVLSEGFKELVFDVGKAWVPGAEGIGPYSGKETFMLVGWLVSWGVLRVLIGKRDVNVRLWFGAFLALLLAATLLLWPPVWHWIAE